MKVLVTGCAGFIGSNLCEYLLAIGHNVIGLDNLSTGYMSNMEDFYDDPNFSFIFGDIRLLKNCMDATLNVDCVLHQAALASVPKSISDPLETNSVNVEGFLNMLEASKRNNVKRFVYAASSSTYGDSKDIPSTEENIGKPLSPYAITKYVNELYAEIYSSTFGIETIGLRYFNVFGRRQDPNGAYAAVIPKFIDKFLRGESPIINGDGSFSRDFTYIDNVLQMNHLAMTTKDSNAVNQIYNSANGDRVTITEITELIREELSKTEVEIKFGPNRNGDIPHSQASIDKAKRLLKYKPSYNLKEGIKETISWYLK